MGHSLSCKLLFVCSIVCPISILPGGGQAEVRVGGGPSGIVYGLQVPPQALVPAPGVGLSHAGGGKVRAGGLPLLGGACRHRSAPGAAVAPAPCFLCEIWAQICAQDNAREVGTQKEVENSIYSLKMELWEKKEKSSPNQGCTY